MDQNIKNRLVGIVVMFALAVIFLPMILDGDGVRKDKLDVVIPAAPEIKGDAQFETRLIELQAKVDELPELDARFIDDDSGHDKKETEADVTAKPDTAESEDANAATTVLKDEEEAEKKPEVKKKAEVVPDPVKPEKVGGDSWVLQVGSFQDRKKAIIQRDRLRKSNIAAVFIEQFDIDSKSNYRVRLGPFPNRDLTKVAQNKIKAKHDIDGIIMKYER